MLTRQNFLNDPHLGDQLQVERSGDLQLLANGMDDHLDPLHRLLIEILRWRHQCGVTRVNAGVLHVFRHRDGHHHSVAGYSVHVYLLENAKKCYRHIELFTLSHRGPESPLLSNLGLLYEFGDDNWVFLGHSHSVGQILLEVAVTVGDIHGRSAKNVGRTNQAGVTHGLTELHSRLEKNKKRLKYSMQKSPQTIIYPPTSYKKSPNLKTKFVVPQCQRAPSTAAG